jgi:hypothetical protein
MIVLLFMDYICAVSKTETTVLKIVLPAMASLLLVACIWLVCKSTGWILLYVSGCTVDEIPIRNNIDL